MRDVEGVFNEQLTVFSSGDAPYFPICPFHCIPTSRVHDYLDTQTADMNTSSNEITLEINTYLLPSELDLLGTIL